MNCANIMYPVLAVPIPDCVGTSCVVVNNWYYYYIVCNDACMNLQYLNVFKCHKCLHTVSLSTSVSDRLN